MTSPRCATSDSIPSPEKANKKRKSKRRAKPSKANRDESHLTFDSGTTRKLLEMLTLGKPTSLHWAAPAEKTNSPLLKQAAAWAREQASPSARKLSARLDDWLESLAHRGPGLILSLECLAWCHLLPGLATVMSADRVNELLDQLTTISRDAANLELSRQPVEHQILAGELPLVLSMLRAGTATRRESQKAAIATLVKGLDDMLDGDGMPHARDLASHRLLLACWTRCAFLGKLMDIEPLPGDARLHYEWLVRQAIRLTRHDGQPVLLGDDGSFAAEMFSTALALAGDRADRAMADCVLPRGKHSAKRAKKSGDLVNAPEPSCYSEWSEVAVLRTGWKRPNEYFATTFSGPEFQGELSSAKSRLLLGEWETHLRVDGRPLAIDSEWCELCWHCDDDVDYLEIEQKWSGGWKLQRQMLIGRQDRFFYLADAVVGDSAAQIEYEVGLPLAEDVLFAPHEETREGELRSGRPLATVYPLALPEWRTAHCSGSLAQHDRRLKLSQSAHAQRLYAPLMFDLSARRSRSERTWRQLTVAERLVIQPADMAVGYRVQIGRDQWLIYRSLGPVDNRTVLGHNLSHEFLCAQFDTDGEVNSLIQIDSD